MRRKFIAAIAISGAEFSGGASVNAQNIIKVGKDINIGNDQRVNNALPLRSNNRQRTG